MAVQAARDLGQHLLAQPQLLPSDLPLLLAVHGDLRLLPQLDLLPLLEVHGDHLLLPQLAPLLQHPLAPHLLGAGVMLAQLLAQAPALNTSQ